MRARRKRTVTARARATLKRVLDRLEPTPSPALAGVPRSSTMMQRFGHPTARALSKCSVLAVRVRQWRIARATAVAATLAGPRSVDAWLALAASCRLGSVAGVVNDPVRGLIAGPIGDARGALLAATHATRIAPSDPRAFDDVGRAHQLDGALDLAQSAFERATELDPNRADTWYALARVEAARAARCGLLSPDHLSRHRELTTAALAADPGHRHARYHAVRVAIRAADWESAVAAADLGTSTSGLGQLIPNARSTPDAERIVEAAMDEDGSEMLVVAFWRLQQLGTCQHAFAVKDRLAESLLAGSAGEGIQAATTAVRALATLHRPDDASGVIREALEVRPSRRDRATLAKLRSDLEFLDGAVCAHRHQPWRATSAAEGRFDQLVRGKSVAVLGPLTIGDPPSLDEFDVVLRTKHLGEACGFEGPIIAYFANASARLLRDEIDRAIDEGDIDLAVFRPSLLDIEGQRLLEQQGVRVAQTENAALLEASHYGVPRVVYDALRYEPARLEVFNADFFIGGRRYDDGYQRDRQLGLTEAVVGYGHDLRADHRAMSRLLQRGVIDASPPVRGVLELPSDEYLARIDTASR